MREIKFRAKRKDNTPHNGRWVCGQYFVTPLTDENSGAPADTGWCFLAGEQRHCIVQDGVSYVVDVNTLGQYTGIDSKGKEPIYEGDIVQCKFYYASRPWWKNLEHKAVVDAKFEQMKSQVETRCGFVKYHNGKFIIQYSWDVVDLHYVESQKIERSNILGGEFESRWWDFEKVGDIYDDSTLLSEGGDDK